MSQGLLGNGVGGYVGQPAVGPDPNAGTVSNVMMPNPNTPTNAVTGSASAPSYSPATVGAPGSTQSTGLAPADSSGLGGLVDETQPGTGENVSNAFLNYYSQNGTPTTSNNAQQAYQSFNQSVPADMSSYYNNAQRLQDNAINTQMAARGSYGSSNAIGQLGAADTNLRANEAQANAQYGLQRAGLMGTLGSASDQSSQAQSQNEQNWMQGLSSLGFENQKEGTSRTQLVGQNQLQGANTMSGLIGQNGQAEMNNDQNLLNAMLQAGSGATADQVTAMQNKLAQQQNTSAQNQSATNGAIQAGTSALTSFV
jgi:hypothetical protein